MRLLLDTHIALWSVTGDAQLSRDAHRLIGGADDPVVSVVAIWEIAIKHALRGKRRKQMVVSGHDATRHFIDAGFTILPVTAEHAAAGDDLPPHHGDPFDRMLVAQATCESMRLLSADRQLAAYGPTVLIV